MKRILVLLVIFTVTGVASGGFKEKFIEEFVKKPWGAPPSQESVCISCHTSDLMKEEFKEIVRQWRQSWHAKNNISCHDCHGGDPKDEKMAMSEERGFVGVPSYTEVPEFCGKCHAGVLENYYKSGHGMALKNDGTGPNCVICHGSHQIQRATIDIINEKRCSQCHTYERAKIMKQALFSTEKKITDLYDAIERLKKKGIYTEELYKEVFRTEADFRLLFHEVNVSLIKESTDDFLKRLSKIEEKTARLFSELRFRQNFSAFIMLLLAGLGIVIFLISKRGP